MKEVLGRVLLSLFFLLFIVLSVLFFATGWENNEFNLLPQETKRAMLAKQPPFKIDVVYLWAGEGHSQENKRLRDNGELKHSLRSVYRFLPWINHIHIIMNPPKKVPSWFQEDRYQQYVTLWDHNDLKNDGIPFNLPSKNSTNLETLIANIPGLTEHFIYMNDDFFITSELPYLSFFTEQGEAKIPHFYRFNRLKQLKSTKHKFPMPRQSSYPFTHTPMALRKSDFLATIEKYKEWVELNRKEPTRNHLGCDVCKLEGFNVCPCFLIYIPVQHRMYKRGTGVPDSNRKQRLRSLSYIENSTAFMLRKLKPGTRFAPDYTCINDHGPARFRGEIKKQLARMFPVKTPYEK